MIQTEDYVLSCYRYNELNPVRANMVKHHRDYKWSSYKTNAEDKNSILITPHDEYIKLDRNELTRRKPYRELFKAHIDDDIDNQIRAATNGNYALGNNRFQEQIEKALGCRVTKGKAGRPKMKDVD